MSILLKSNGVTKNFGGLVAVNRFDFELPEGKIISIIGPNGAGKTTFFNCITGVYEIKEGTIELNETILNGKSPDQITRLGIARTYQNIRLFPAMTAIENILVGEHPRLKTFWAEAIFQTKRVREEEAGALEEALRLINFVGLQGLGDQ
jgi:branched-chain amino acid transport system ATP-binding protein